MLRLSSVSLRSSDLVFLPDQVLLLSFLSIYSSAFCWSRALSNLVFINFLIYSPFSSISPVVGFFSPKVSSSVIHL